MNKKIKEERDFFKSMVTTAGVGLVVLSRDFEIIWANDIICRDFIGEEVVGKTCYEMYAGREKICAGCGLVSIFSGENKQGVKERCGKDCNGNEIWSEVIARPCTFDEKGEVETVVQVVTCITARKKAEEEVRISQGNLETIVEERTRELRESEANLRSIFKAADNVSLIKTDIAGSKSIILDFSPGAEKIFGYKVEEVIGKPVAILHLKEDVAKFASVHRAMSENREGFSGESTLVRKSGEHFPALFSTHPVFDDKGKLVAAIGVSIDMSEQKKAQEELHKMQKLKSVGTLAGGIAHDFNNLLAGIIGHIELAGELGDGGVELQSLLNEAKNASMRAKDLTTQLLTFAQGGSPVKVTASMEKVITESANFALHGSSVACECTFPEDLWKAKIDTSQMSQVIQNIIINASEAMPTGGVVKVTCENCTDCPICSGLHSVVAESIKVTVTDTGCGIKPEFIDKVFDPYFTTREKGDEKGCGLGLSICYSIVQQHDGAIQIESVVGLGTTVTIYLPALSDTADSSGLGNDVNGETSKDALIMVMDDESMIRNMTGQMLELFGHDVVLAEDGDEAIEVYRQHFKSTNPLDIVILDLTVPGGKGGREAVGEILKIDPEAKVVVASGYSNDPVMADYKKYGFVASLAKPFELKVLKKLINNILHKSSVN